MRALAACLLLAAAAQASKAIPYNADTPRLLLDNPERGYKGLVAFNETVVTLIPPLATSGKVCNYLVTDGSDGNFQQKKLAPFQVWRDSKNIHYLRALWPLERGRVYTIFLGLIGCDGTRRPQVPVSITVLDHALPLPVLSRGEYSVTAQSARLYPELLRVDVSIGEENVCGYRLLGQHHPFSINEHGVLGNSAPLHYERAPYTMKVMAEDCYKRASKPATVVVYVEKPCQPVLNDMSERVEYTAGSGALPLFPTAHLVLCASDHRCAGVSRISAHVTLQTARTGCDRDTYSLKAQRSVCGVDSRVVDLLPSSSSWTSNLQAASLPAPEHSYQLEGHGAVLPPSLLPHTLPSVFAITSWMRHAPPPGHDQHRKEHLLCLADDHKMNRHHYAVFVRNCRLILLLRRDFGDGDLNIFRPAEWRWKLPQVCDDTWHHYTLNVRFPDVELLVDGLPAEVAPEVIDDWPLHPARDVNTTLVLGACWQGAEGGTKHGMHGQLAGLGLLLQDTLPATGALCAVRCREGLSVGAGPLLHRVTVEGDDGADLETLLRKVTYSAARTAPTPGRRNLHVATTVTCVDGGTLTALPVESYLMVSAPRAPRVLLQGGGETARDYAHFRAGVRVFPDVRLQVRQAKVPRVDACGVTVYPALNPDHESLAVSENLAQYDIRATITRDGAQFAGADSTHHYETALRSLVYTNRKPAYYLNRVFKLTCSELDGRFASDEFVQTLTVVHPHVSAESDAHSGIADKMAASERLQQPGGHVAPRLYMSHSQRSSHSAEASGPRVTNVGGEGGAGGGTQAALLMGVVCGGVVLVAGGAAVLRARGRHAHTRPRHARTRAHGDLAWDDSALNITVNPLELAAGPAGLVQPDSAAVLPSDSEDSGSESDDEPPRGAGGYCNVSQLEWDNSTM